MQFRPVGVECPGEELAPESLEFADGVGLSVAAFRRGEGYRADSRHDEPAFFVRRLLSHGALFWALAASFRRDLLKEGFNCPDLAKHGVGPVMIRGERMENAGLAVALWGPRGYISGSNFP
jgi:hypothetical protein